MPILTRGFIVLLVFTLFSIVTLKVISSHALKTHPKNISFERGNLSSQVLAAATESGLNAGAPAMFDTGGELKCSIAIVNPLAPDIYDKIFVDTSTTPPTPESFTVDAHMTDQNSPHKFYLEKGPYKAGIDYNLNPTTKLPYEDLLGEVPLALSTPNNDERDILKDDPTECIKYETRNGDRKCVQYAEDLDPGDKKDSWNVEGKNFSFGVLGHSTVRIYQNDAKQPLSQNQLVCIKDVDSVQSYLLTVVVDQPLYLQNNVVISGVVTDHTKPVPNTIVTLTIGDRSVTTKTNNDGTYVYNLDTTVAWNLPVDKATYSISAKAEISSKQISTSSIFGVNIIPAQSTAQLSPGNNPKIAIYRYYGSSTKDYWTSSDMQNPGPPANIFAQDQPQGDLFVEDDGAGPLVALYDCLSSSNHFNSIYQPNCPNYVRLGYIYGPNNAPPLNTHALYLCKNQVTGDERVSLNSDCKNDPKDIDPYVNELVLGYAIDSNLGVVPNAKKNVGVTVPSNLDIHQKIADLQAAANLPPELVQQVEDNPLNSQPVQIGVGKLSLSSFGDLGCPAKTAEGITLNYCPQTLSLGRGTNLFIGKVDLLYYSHLNPTAVKQPQQYDTSVFADEAGETGNTIITRLANELGSQSSYYTVMFPPAVTTQNQGVTQTVNLTGDICNLPLAVGGLGKETARVGQLDKQLLTYLHGTFPSGVVPPNLGLEGLKCAALK